MAREPIPVETIFSQEQLAEFDTAIRSNDVETFKRLFEENALQPEDNIDGMPLTFYTIDCNRFVGLPFLSIDVLAYLLEQGGNINYMSLNTLAARYSSIFFSLNDGDVDAYTTLAMNAAVKGDLDLLVFLYNEGADLDMLALDEDGNEIPGEDIVYFTRRRLEELDRDIQGIMGLENVYKRNPRLTNAQKQDYISRSINTAQRYSKDRIKVARVLKWLLNITTERNIPTAVTKQQHNAFKKVLNKRVQLGNLELNAFSKFLAKPSTFAIPPTEVGLKHVNTSLFQGGKKTRRRAQKKRKTRKSKL
jgi:hypothetical protein